MSRDQRVLTGARWSSAVVCPRKAVYEHTDAPRGEFDDTTLRRFRRGHAWGKIVADDVVAALRADGQRPRTEEEVPWPAAAPIGIGHADIYLPRARRIVEVFSTDGTSYPAHKGLQAAGYCTNHPNAEDAVVLVVDRATGDERVYPIDVAELEPRVREIEEAVTNAIASGDPPPRAADHPHAFPCSECVFRDHCWDGWDAPPLVVVDGADNDATELADIEDSIAATKQTLKDLEADRAAVRERLAPYLTPGVPAACGGVILRRTITAGRRSFAVGAYEAAGHRLDETAAAFVTDAAPSERWSVKRMRSST